jgi:hypothetical protein
MYASHSSDFIILYINFQAYVYKAVNYVGEIVRVHIINWMLRANS